MRGGKREKEQTMKQLTINPSNKRFYSEDFIKGFECGTQRQLEADKTDRPQGEWEIYTVSPFDGEDCRCSNCGQSGCAPYWNFCPNCGARMKGANTDIDCFDTCKHAYSEVCDECYKGNKYDVAERSRR